MNDINYYLDILTKNITLVEEDKKNKEALNNVYNAFQYIYELIKMYLISKKERYYGYFLMNMKLDIVFNTDLIAGVTINNGEFILRTNPLLLGRYSLKEMLYIICHEIEHIVLNHPSEMVKLNPSKDIMVANKLNYAMDASVNDRLNLDVKEGIISTPKNIVDSRVISKITNANLKELEDYLYYYEALLKVKKKEDKYSKFYIILVDTGEIITSKDNIGSRGHNFIISGEYEEINEQVKGFIKRVNDSIPSTSRGLFPSYQIEALEKQITPPKIKWQQVLKKYVGIIPVPFKKTRTRLNRRQPLRYDISGRINDKTLKIIVAIDTSGSMTNSMLRKIFIEIFDILKRSKFELTIIECDAEIGKVYKAKKIDEINFNITGRGGTSYIPVIEYINKNRCSDSLLIYFTDGYGDSEIPRPKTYKNIWVIIGEKEDFSLREPYGEVLEIDSVASPINFR